MAIQGRKEQKQVVIKHKAEIYAAVRYFALKNLGVNNTSKERK